MMKFTYPIGLGMTALAGLPAAMNPQSLQGTTEEALSSTLAAIDEILLISGAIERREAGAIQRVMDATQPPTGAPAKQDEFISQLRMELRDLQAHVDQQHLMNLFTDQVAGKAPDTTSTRPEPAPRQMPAIPEGQLEPSGYSADTLRQGRLLFRDARFEKAIEVLATLPDNPEADYWAARSFESLGQSDQAIARYEVLIADTKDENIARRAAHDLSFLQWKQRFYGANDK
ncbi:MAG: tetratricopeptide (TPR) repeat protein [Chlamydiales bacterium]|jgi:tetratricopeptide (TPR) repeat protein